MNVAQHRAQNLPFTVLLVNAANLYIRLIDKIHFINQNLLKLCVTAVTVPFMLFLYPIFWIAYCILFKINHTPPENYTEMRTKYDHLSNFLADDNTLYIRSLNLAKQPFYVRSFVRLIQQYYDRLSVQHNALQTVIDELNKPANYRKRIVDKQTPVISIPRLKNV
jgi:hypothetical protein